MNGPLRIIAVAGILLALGSGGTEQVDSTDLPGQVSNVERAFAKTMADRDHAAFVSFLSQEAVFLSREAIHAGKQAVSDQWKAFFVEPGAPFSWEPETVAVLDSGELAISTGPVRDPDGRGITTFTSIWRQEEPGVWRIIFDKGDRYCESPRTGVVSLEEILRYEVAVVDEAEFDAGYVEMLDLRSVEKLAMSRDEIVRIVGYERSHERYLGSRRVAFVALADLDFGLGRMYELMEDDSPMETRVFRDWETACEWAGLSPADLEAG